MVYNDMRNILKLLKFSILFQMRRRKSDIFEKTEIWIRTTYINTSFDRKFYADFKFSCHKFRRPRILKKTSLGEVSLYQDNNPLKYSQYHSSSWYKDTSPMPEYRYGTTCKAVCCLSWLKSCPSSDFNDFDYGNGS